MDMKIFGIFGDPIEHSLSPAMQNAALHAIGEAGSYLAFRVRAEDLRAALIGAGAMGFSGLNLTIPLKEKALELDVLEPDALARAIGAVNTVSFSEGCIKGYNTDGWGAHLALQEAGVAVRGKNVLLIGAGGAARAIAYTLHQEGARISIANRNIKRAQELAELVGAVSYSLSSLAEHVKQADIIINCTSVGMREGDPRLFEAGILKRDHVVFDIVYNRETQLLLDARAAGALALDGVMMLVHQGRKALEIWTGRKAPVDVMVRAVREALTARQTASGRREAFSAQETRE
ncbi:MAG TPA: shikimate dehydrogenase [Methanothrix sp.]|nr:shikimate dehydrogenase [Methanothrix sp.]